MPGSAMATQDIAGAAESGTYAMIEVGTLRLAVNTRHVVQAIPRPAHLTLLPRGKGALAGVFSHRGQVVPLVSLDRWLHSADGADSDGAQVLILRDGDKVMGLAVDAVRGLVRLTPADIHRVHHDDDPDEFFHSVALTGDGAQPLSLLDPARLATRAQAWAATVAPASVAGSDLLPDAGSTTSDGQPMDQVFAVMRLDKSLVGFAARHVGEVLPMPKVQRIVGSGTDFLGMTVWRGRDVPIMSIGAQLGLPVQAPGTLLVVLCDGDRCVGIAASEVAAVRTFRASDIQTNVAVADSQAPLHAGTAVQQNGERIFLLHADALIHASPLSALSQTQGQTRRTLQGADATGDPDSMSHSDGAYVVFRARRELAAPLGLMQEITRFPAEFRAAAAPVNGLLGTCEWRGQTLALLDPAAGDSQTATAPNERTRVIVVRVNGQTAGLVADEVLALLPAQTGEHKRFSIARDTTVHMITVGQGEAQKSYRVLDLGALPYFRRLQATPET